MAARKQVESDPYRVMTEELLEEVVRDFLVAAEDYGEAFRELGPRGQYSDMHRKMAKLKRAVWDGEELQREQPREIAADLIAHCLILMFLLDEEGDR